MLTYRGVCDREGHKSVWLDFLGWIMLAFMFDYFRRRAVRGGVVLIYSSLLVTLFFLWTNYILAYKTITVSFPLLLHMSGENVPRVKSKQNLTLGVWKTECQFNPYIEGIISVHRTVLRMYVCAFKDHQPLQVPTTTALASLKLLCAEQNRDRTKLSLKILSHNIYKAKFYTWASHVSTTDKTYPNMTSASSPLVVYPNLVLIPPWVSRR